ncbi:hypothetical protein [Acinetobacter indicus]|uniref:hypothetical protein n=1 Tax=Acinetobacter indicus TaxID=756892 RepID=UPI002578F610|nr:hypothetical protein [Acinetobacter indicus]MDM1302048.1 hypothetical protein [Acinetobacter indicus]
MWVTPQVVAATLGLFFVCEINIAFPILLVNRKPDKNIEKPIFFIFYYVLIDKRKPTMVVGCLEFVMGVKSIEISATSLTEIAKLKNIIEKGLKRKNSVKITRS